MNDVLRIARLKIALQRAFLGRAILIFTSKAPPVIFYEIANAVHASADHIVSACYYSTQVWMPYKSKENWFE